MFRTRLVGVALLTLAVLPGCTCWRNHNGPLARMWARHHAPADATPVSYAGGEDCGMPIGASTGGPIIIPPGGVLPLPGDAKIPTAGIDEGKGGKQFELEGLKKGGPDLSAPITGGLKGK